MADVSSSEFDYRRDGGEDTEAQNAPKCQLATDVHFDIPEQNHRDGYDCCFQYIGQCGLRSVRPTQGIRDNVQCR